MEKSNNSTEKNWKEVLKDNSIRIIYTIFSLLALVISILFGNHIIDNQVLLNKFGFYGGIATFIGLVIAIMEIIHNVKLSKGIKSEAKTLFENVSRVNHAAYFSEYLISLDETNDHLSGDRYLQALKCFQYYRRTYARLPIDSSMHDSLRDLIRNTEVSLHSYSNATPKNPITKQQRTEIQTSILAIKSKIEDISRQKGF
ncbi:hypothetical protein [Delftia sp. WY8]|uniref:hypothetical protein n=1 Tax=Delftia sp. WY8 TaxID=2708352 RepID=UPI001BCC69EB|nr:hypothetical protein [Delftia sp. WY8]